MIDGISNGNLHNGLAIRIVTEPPLTGAVPNPFNPQTDIKFSLPRDPTVKLDLYDVSSRPVRSLLNDTMSARAHSLPCSGN